MPRVRVVKNCKLNEDMDKVRALKLPKCTWDVEGEEEWFRSASGEEHDDGEEVIDREAELQPKLAEQLANNVCQVGGKGIFIGCRDQSEKYCLEGTS